MVSYLLDAMHGANDYEIATTIERIALEAVSA